jgi:TPR repeat protein
MRTPDFGCARVALFLSALLACSLPCLEANPAAAAGRHVALIVGNASYENLPELPNTTNDAKAVRSTLEAAGFEVYFGTNVKRLDFEDLLKRFYRAADGSEIALVYYSGHGVQVGGSNYVVPTDAKLNTAYDIELQTLRVQDIYDYLSAHSRAQLIFLDACRVNPFRIQQFWIVDSLKTVGATTGLARSASNIGSLIAFSTEPGKVAYDGTGPTSPYTGAFVRHITTPNEEIRQALTQVRRDVIAATGGEQVPWENSSLVDDIYLVKAPPPPVVTPFLRVNASSGAPVAVNIPAPKTTTNEPLKIQIDRPPDQGRLLLNGKEIDPTAPLSAADLDKLTFDPAGAPNGAIGLWSYVVSDPWSQSTRGVVAVAIGPGDSPAARRDDEQAKSAALATSRRYFIGLDHFRGHAMIGVGAVPIGLAAPSTSGLDLSLQAEVTSGTEIGSLSVDGRTLTVGSRLALEEMPRVAFFPKIDSADRQGVVSLVLLDTPREQISLAISPDVSACDAEAGAPLDLQGVGRGKLPNEINAAAAIAACQSASNSHPNVARFAYELGRAQLAAGNAEEARRNFTAAAEQKHMRAVEALGDMELFGTLGRADPAKAAEYYKKCADAGDAYCLHSYGKALFYGQGLAKDVSRGLTLMIRAAELGHTYAMNELGYIFTYGRDVSADVERGIRYYEAGAARGDIYSYNNLGLVYMRGAGRKVDYAKALDYFTKASNGGQPYAPTNLGQMYRDGKGVAVDLSAAAKWLELGAKRGDYWGALDRARLFTDDPVQRASYLALAVSLNVDRGNSDPQQQALHELASMGATDKRRALEMLEGQLGAEVGQIAAANLDDRLVEASRRLWVRGRPRFDLF